MLYNLEEEYEKYVQEIGGRVISSEEPAQRIREVRVSVGATQEEVGRLLGLRRETISRIENSIIKPTFNFIRRFSEVMAATKIVRDLYALEEATLAQGRNIALSPAYLRLYFNVPAQDLRLISDIGARGYQKSRARVIREIKKEVKVRA